jgi:Flp pilus assembly protein TadG
MSRSRGDARGQTLVEFALILPVFILMLVGIFDVGRAVFAYNTLNNAAREGGRVAIVDQTGAHVCARAAEQSVTLNASMPCQPVTPPTASDTGFVEIDYRDPGTPDTAGSCVANLTSDRIVGCLAVVTVTYNYSAATPIISQIIGPLALTGETHFRVEFNCQEPNKPQCPVGD